MYFRPLLHRKYPKKRGPIKLLYPFTIKEFNKKGQDDRQPER